MDKRQSEHIEDRFRQAAEHVVPSFNEEAWNKMELLLEKDQKRRKPFIWWWLFGLLLFVGGAAGIYHYSRNRVPVENSKPGEKPSLVQTPAPANNSTRPVEQDGKQVPSLAGVPEQPTTGKKTDAMQESTTLAPASAGKQQQPGGENLFSSSSRRNKGARRPVGGNEPGFGTTIAKKTFAPHARSEKDQYKGNEETTRLLQSIVQQSSEEETDLKTARPLFAYQQPDFLIRVEMPDAWLNPPHDELALKDSLQSAIKAATKKAQKQGHPVAEWYFLASGGVDAANLHKFDTSHRRFVFGADVGYHLNRIFSVQAGFHAGRALYVAGPTDYKVKAGTYLSDPNIKIRSVDANCFLFDLPLLIRADVLHNRNRALYATAGFSSSITNREAYVYHYNNMGYRIWKASYKGNVDWFSYADFSLGFEQKILKTFYLQLEPYARLPLTGIGEGKVKLYSLGVQLGLKYQPLKKK